jgi:glycosyltransferase involved in cell wall biosynthesis
MKSGHFHLWQRQWRRVGAVPEGPNTPQEGISLSSLKDVSCLVLLGAPGLGKSSEVRLEAQSSVARGEVADIVSLGRITGTDELESLILSKARRPELGSAIWNLFLDGLDESLPQITQSQDGISSVFRKLSAIKDLSSVRLRLTCRSAEWPSSIGAALKEIWGASNTEIYELQELSEKDIRVAASELPPELSAAFLSQIERREVDALARRPVTLNMLLEVFAKNSELPAQRAQLYRDALLLSIEAAGKQRADPSLDGRSQMIVAARIAAASIFSNSTEISIGVLRQTKAGRVVAISEIAGGYEPASSGSFHVGDIELHEALLSPLFVSVSETLFAWSHQTFAEFLAAYYLIERGLDPQNILDFLRSAENRRIPPQLREVSAWLASMDDALFDALAETDPDILLSSDVASASPQARETLVGGLLLRFDRAELHDFNPQDRLRYDRLGHPRLGEQLLPYILDKEKNVVVRRVAIDIAEENGGAGIEDTLADVSLDPKETLHIRTQAAAAVSKVGNETVRLRLRPLLEANSVDENDELKGWALRTLWPKHLSVRELINSLTPEKNNSWIGSYTFFISTLELPELTDTEAQEVLQWIAVVASEEERSRTLSRAIPKFLDRVWDRSDRPTVRNSFARFFLDLYSSAQYSILQEDAKEFLLRLSRGGERRLLLVEEIVKLSKSANWSWLAFAFPFPFITLEDLPWLLEHLRSPTPQFPEEAAAQLILAVIPRDDIERLNPIWKAAESSKVLASGLVSLFSCEVNTPTAKWQREDFEKRTARLAEVEKRRFDALSAVETRLQQVELANSFGWWELNLAFLADDKGVLNQEFQSDLTSTKLWTAISDTMRARLLVVAARYLTENKLPSSSWLGTNTFHRPAAAGYRAMRLLLDCARDKFFHLSADVWKNWSSCIFISFNETEEGRKANEIIAARAYELAPERVMRSLARILFKSKSDHDAKHAIRLLDQCYNENVGSLLWAIFSKLEPGKVREALIGHLARKSFHQVVTALLHDLDSGSSTLSTMYSEAEFVAGVSSLLQSDPAAVWPNFVRFRATHGPLAIEIMRSFEFDSPFISKMSEMDLADFYIWTYKEMPPLAEEKRGARSIGPDEQIDHLRHAVLRHLTALGTSSAVAAVRRIATEVTQAPWLKYHILDARRAFDATAWRLREPSEVISAIALLGPIEPPRSTKAALADVADANSRNLRGVDEVLSSTPASTIEEIPRPTAAPIVRRRILAVATEWRSGHGGLSTVNRELCVALAKLGHEVVCLVLSATDEEAGHAMAANVRLATPRKDPFPEQTDVIMRLLLFSRRKLQEFEPDVVVGHDHITGTAARHIAHDVYDAPYIHFIHTLPEEIERHKTRGPQSVLKGAMKGQVQIEQCKSADLVVAIGPRIFQQISGRLSHAEVPVVEMWPGLSSALVGHVVNPAQQRGVNCLLIARFEDPVLKGAPLACHVIGKINATWSGKPWTRPQLIMRGFTVDGVDDEIRAIDGYKAAEDYVTCRPYTQIEDDIAADICGSSVVLMPSKSEGFGLSALEGIAAGIPALISSESGLAQLLLQADISPVVTGIASDWVADVTGPDPNAIIADWASRVEKIVADPSTAFEQAKQVRDNLSSVLSWENAARKFSLAWISMEAESANAR